MKERKREVEDTLRPEYDLDKLEVAAYGSGWVQRRRLLRKKGRVRALNPKRRAAIPNPALPLVAARRG